MYSATAWGGKTTFTRAALNCHDAPRRTFEEIRAGYAGHWDLCELASVTDRRSDDDTLLHVAAFLGVERDVRDLLALGAVVDGKGDLGHTPLHYAAMRGHLDVVSAPLAAGANLYFRTSLAKLLQIALRGPAIRRL